MRETVTYVTQSKYFTPAFNAAIFDGPIRIYFAQYQESQALKLYFHFQERYTDLRKQARGMFKDRDRNIFVMLYPTEETFDLSFGSAFGSPLGLSEPRAMGAGAEAGVLRREMITSEEMGADYVVGVRGPIEDDMFQKLCEKVDVIVRAHDN